MAAAQASAELNIPEMAQERLEKFQIRRENQALLEKITSIGVQRDKDLEDIRQQYEAALESNKETLARIEGLELKIAQRDREVDEFVEDLQRFKGTVEAFLRNRASEEEREEVMSVATAGRPSSAFIPVPDAEDEARSSNGLPAPSMPTRPTRRAANRKSSYVHRESDPQHPRLEASTRNVGGLSEGLVLVKADLIKPTFTSEPLQDDPSRNNRKRLTDTRPAEAEPTRPPPMMTRQRSRSKSEELSKAKPGAPGFPNIPKLSQDRRPLAAYYKASSKIYMSLRLDGGQPEFDFISSFISGITSKKEKNRLIDSLANFCFCDTKDDGTRQILCTWDEVMDGLKAAELVGGEKGGEYDGENREVVGSVDAPFAFNTPIMNNSRAAEGPNAGEQPAMRISRGRTTAHATYASAGGKAGRELTRMDPKHKGSVPGKDSGGMDKSHSTNVKSGTAIKNTGPSKSNATAKPIAGKGKAAQRVAKRPAPKKSKAHAAIHAIDIDDSNNTSAVGNQDAAVGAGKGARRGAQRAGKR